MKKQIFKVIKLVHRFTGKLVNKSEQKYVSQKNKMWDSKFNDAEKFVYNLSADVKINLYKDSVLSKPIFNGFENGEIAFMKRTLNNGDIFIDIGSNIGLFALEASPIVGNQGHVIAFEPSPDTFGRLLENVELNNFKNIECRNKGVSDKKEMLEISISSSGYDAWNTFAPGDSDKFHKTVSVEVNSLDDELKDIDKKRIKLIKIDVEGWEKFVLLGAEDLLRNYNPIFMMEFTESNTFAAGYMVQELYDMLVEKGYEWFKYKDDTLFPESKKLHYPYDNLIAIKKP